MKEKNDLASIANESLKEEDESTDSTSSSDDESINSSDEALCDVLGLPSLTGMVMEEEEEDSKTTMYPLPIGLPSTKGVSRKYFASRDCLAYEIPNVLTPDECLELISLAANSAPISSVFINDGESSDANPLSSFRYITHAVHTAPDGKTKFEVKLERPNPHKLAVFRHGSWVDTLWNRLRPLLVWKNKSEPSANGEINDQGVPCLSQTLKNFVHRESLLAPPVGLNPRLRVLRYDASDNDEFQAHFDATTEIHQTTPSQKSYLTVLLYLNDGGGIEFEGGETEFLSQHDASVQKSETPSRRNSTSTSDDAKEIGSGTVKITPKAGSVVLFEHDLFHRGRPLLWGTKYVLRTDVMFANRGTTTDREPSKSKGAMSKSLNAVPSSTDDNNDNDAVVLSTVEDVLCRVEEHFRFESQQETEEANITVLLRFLRDALSNGMGFGDDLNNTTIDCLCSPGRFALNLMLREHIVLSMKSSSSTPKNQSVSLRINHQTVLDRFLDAAYDALKQSK